MIVITDRQGLTDSLLNLLNQLLGQLLTAVEYAADHPAPTLAVRHINQLMLRDAALVGNDLADGILPKLRMTDICFFKKNLIIVRDVNWVPTVDDIYMSSPRSVESTSSYYHHMLSFDISSTTPKPQ